jgi:hypothetical protein
MTPRSPNTYSSEGNCADVLIITDKGIKLTGEGREQDIALRGVRSFVINSDYKLCAHTG